MEIREEEFRRRVKAERERRGWTQADLADHLNERGGKFYPSTIAKIEQSARAIRLEEAAALAEVFETGVDEMLGTPKVFDRALALDYLADVAARAYSAVSDAVVVVSDAKNGLRMTTEDAELAGGDSGDAFMLDDGMVTEKKAMLAHFTAMLFLNQAEEALRTLSGVSAIVRLPESEVGEYWANGISGLLERLDSHQVSDPGGEKCAGARPVPVAQSGRVRGTRRRPSRGVPEGRIDDDA